MGLDTVVKAKQSLISLGNQTQSPDRSTALVSFNFLKDIPIEEFVV